MNSTSDHRRRLLRFLAASPLASPALLSGSALAQISADRDYLPETPDAAVNVFDMENLARTRLSDAHWTYIQQGVDDELTLEANREGFRQLHLKAKRLVDVSRVDMRTTLFGEPLRSPVLLAPVGGLGMAHSNGDVEVAAGARDSDHRMILSTAATFGIERVVEARGEPVWFQLYPTDDWAVTRALLRRVENAGTRVLFLTVDIPARNQDRMRRFDRGADECRACHDPNATFADKAMMEGIDLQPGTSVTHPGMDWEFVRRLRDATDMKLVIKGLTLAEDAALAVENGVDGILVSNHGGRADASGYATIRSLPEVVTAVNGAVPVLVDGGIRRGTDILKALALGADAVCIGRPYIWGLGAFGREGVTRVMDILDAELEIAMRQAGTPGLAAVTPDILR